MAAQNYICTESTNDFFLFSFIFYYGTQFFKNTGITNPFIISMITSAVNVSSTLPGLYAIDKWGRRPLLLWGAIGMCVSQLIVAVSGVTTTAQREDGSVYSTNIAGQRASIAFVCIYIFFFASTWVSSFPIIHIPNLSTDILYRVQSHGL